MREATPAVETSQCVLQEYPTNITGVSVASHLGINLADYDRKIRSFIPDYETMLNVGAAAVPRGARLIVDLGTGTGALAKRCLRRAPRARIIGIDLDEGMMAMAARRPLCAVRFYAPICRAAMPWSRLWPFTTSEHARRRQRCTAESDTP
jgi:Methyltransferase domain